MHFLTSPFCTLAHNEKSDLIDRMVAFLNDIGIPTVEEPITHSTFLPGIHINKGAIHFDRKLLKHPGDMLHEAGHIAVLSPEDRMKVTGDLRDYQTPEESDELGAILWSYAALRHLDIAPEAVFHSEGYKGDAEWLISQFDQKIYIGLPYLEWKNISNRFIFPKVTQWLAD